MATRQELQIAGWVAELVEHEFGTVPGPPTKRDGQDGSGLTVDFTFDDAAPPFAVEVTRLRDDFELWDADDVRRFNRRPPVRLRSSLDPGFRSALKDVSGESPMLQSGTGGGTHARMDGRGVVTRYRVYDRDLQV